MALTIELGEAAKPHPCRCCGETTYMVYGLVYHDGHAHAVYFAGWSEGHRDQGLRMAVGIGDWDEGATAQDRISVGFSARLVLPQVFFDVVEPADSPWGDYDYIGKMLSKDDALGHPYLEAFLDAAKAAVRDDGRVRGFLQRLSPKD
ncbi:MAG: hypothetical protein ABI333_18475 [bacterium]